MVINSSLTSQFLNSPGSDRLSYKKKIADNYAWARQRMDYLCNQYNYYNEKKEKFKINYELYNGRMDFNSYINTGNTIQTELGMDIPEMEINQSDFIHFPILQTVLHDLEGEEIKRPFNLRVVSTNSTSESIRQKTRRELLVENTSKIVKQDLLNKAKLANQKRMEQIKAQMDPSMDPDYMNKLQEISDSLDAQLEETVNKMTPIEVETYMAKGFKLPEEKLTDELLQYHIRTDRIKLVFDKGWKDVIISGEEIYWTGELNGKPVIKACNPLYFNYAKSKDVDFLDEADWCTYDEYISIYEIYQKFGNIITEEEREVFDKYESTLNSPSDSKVWEIIPNAIMNPTDSEATPSWVDPWEDDYTDNFKIRRLRVTHVVWKSLKKIKYIFRLNENGTLEKTIADETYVFNKETDVKQEIIFIPEFWHGYKIFTNPKIYLKIEPIPNQYRDIDNPFQIRGPYTGSVYSARNSAPIAIADLGKPWQFLYNVIINQIIELMKTDIGRVLMGISEQIPKEMTPTQWMTYIKKFKVALISASREGDMRTVGVDPQYWKSIDLSHTQEISQKIELLEYIEKKMAQSMSYNPGRLGQQSPYESIGNNQQSIIQSSNQTEKWFYMHNYVKERTVENYIEICKVIYKDNPLKASYILSDLSVATLNTEVADFANYNYKVFITNTLRDTEIIGQLKNLIQPIIQNSNGDLRVATEILTTENATEVKNIINRIQQQKQPKEEQMQKAQQEQQMQMQQMQIQSEQEKMKIEKQMADDKNATTLRAAELNAERFARANDVNEDGTNDLIELQMMKNESEAATDLNDAKIEQILLQNKKIETEISLMKKKGNEKK
jgi:hypothetical protein